MAVLCVSRLFKSSSHVIRAIRTSTQMLTSYIVLFILLSFTFCVSPSHSFWGCVFGPFHPIPHYWHHSLLESVVTWRALPVKAPTFIGPLVFLIVLLLTPSPLTPFQVSFQYFYFILCFTLQMLWPGLVTGNKHWVH